MIFQPNGYTCVPTCLKMVLNYLSNFSEETKLNLEIEDICKIIGTTTDGTIFDDVQNINSDNRVLKTIPSIEFIVKYERHTLAEIEEEYNKGKPSIAWILPPGTDPRDMQHSIVITSINREEYKIAYNDPIFGEIEMELGNFMSLWDRTDRNLIKIKLGEREQRLLDEWFERSGTLK